MLVAIATAACTVMLFIFILLAFFGVQLYDYLEITNSLDFNTMSIGVLANDEKSAVGNYNSYTRR